MSALAALFRDRGETGTKWGVATKRSPYLVLAFSILFVLFFVGPPFLSKPFGPYPLMKVGDVFDLLTPWVLIAVYWLLFRMDEAQLPTPRQEVLFVVLAALWVQGQGMHLAANSIGHLLKDAPGTDSYVLTYFYDEILSHYLWHIGVMGLSGLLLVQQWRCRTEGEPTSRWMPLIAAVLYGITYFMIVVEGGTALIGVPFALATALWGLLRGRERIKKQPVLALFFVGYLVASLLFLGWGIYWRGLPQFSEVGIIE